MNGKDTSSYDDIRARVEAAEHDAFLWKRVLDYNCAVSLTVAERAEKKIASLHTIINKQTARIKRQSDRITELEALYAGTKRSRNSKKLKEKYKALKQDWDARYGIS